MVEDYKYIRILRQNPLGQNPHDKTPPPPQTRLS